jgi:hypothetical protein
MGLVAALILLLIQDEPPPHRHVATDRFPLPDWVVDQQMRQLLEQEIRSGELSKWLSNPKDREGFMKWLKEYVDKGGDPNNPIRMWEDLKKRNPDLYKRFESRIMANPSKYKIEKFRELLNRIGKQYDTRHPPAWFDPRMLDQLGKPDTSPLGTELMNQVMGNEEWTDKLTRGLSNGLDSLESFVGRWGKGEGASNNPSSSSSPSPWTPVTNPGDSGGPRPTGPGNLPAILPQIQTPLGPAAPSTTLLWAFVIITGAGMSIYLALVWIGSRVHRPKEIPPEKFEIPKLPDAFATRQDFFEFYRAMHRFALQRRLTGLSHKEIAASCRTEIAQHVSDVFEELYYNPRAQDGVGRAHQACRKMMGSLAAR